MVNPYRACRQLERLLFGGVPERPEPNWERDGFNGQVEDRETGRALLSYEAPDETQGRLIARIKYTADADEVEYVCEAVDQESVRNDSAP